MRAIWLPILAAQSTNTVPTINPRCWNRITLAAIEKSNPLFLWRKNLKL
jgi:hypothetical protein